MPVRDKAVSQVLHALGLKMSFNNVHFTAKVNGEVMSRDKFNERFWNPIDRIYEEVVDSIDWNRVFLEASSRHIALDHDTEDMMGYGQVCPECLGEALLTRQFLDWEQTPTVPRLDDEVED